MKILNVDKECYFIINNEPVNPKELTKENLLTLFNKIYELEDVNVVDIPEDDVIDDIKNPIDKEIVKQIIQKIHEFIDNVEEIKQDINSSFPTLNN